MEVAIIKWNEGNSYYSKLMESLGIPFKEWQMEELRNIEKKEKDRKNKQKTSKAEEKRKINRKKFKQRKSKSNKKNKNQYNMISNNKDSDEETSYESIEKNICSSTMNERNQTSSSATSSNSESEDRNIYNDISNYIEDGVFSEIGSQVIDDLFDTESSDENLSRTICGYKNINNNCFILAALHMFSASPILMEKLKKTRNFDFEESLEIKLLYELYTIMKNTNAEIGTETSSLQEIFEILMNGEYKIGEHFDCQEFMQICMNIIENAEIYNFKMNINSVFKCVKCGYEYNKSDTDNFIRIPCERHAHTLKLEEEICRIFSEKIEDEIECCNEQEHGHSNFLEFTILEHIPDIVIFHLMRFDDTGKISDRYSFPEVLDMNEITNNENDENLYHLKSVICHLGNECNSGHYICYRLIGKIWMKCDGENLDIIKNINCNETQRNGYLFWYEKTKQ